MWSARTSVRSAVVQCASSVGGSPVRPTRRTPPLFWAPRRRRPRREHGDPCERDAVTNSRSRNGDASARWCTPPLRPFAVRGGVGIARIVGPSRTAGSRTGPSASVERRAVRRPGLERLEGRGRPQDQRVRVPPPDDLEPDRQALRGEAAGDAGRRLTGQVEGKREAEPVEEARGGPAADRRRALVRTRARVGRPGAAPAAAASAGGRRSRRTGGPDRRRRCAGRPPWACSTARDAPPVLDHPHQARLDPLGPLRRPVQVAARVGHVADHLVEGAGVRPARVARLHLRAEIGEAERGGLGDPPDLGVHRRVPEVGAPHDGQAPEVAVAGRQVSPGAARRC